MLQHVSGTCLIFFFMKIVREGHLYSIREVYSDDIDKVTIIFPNFKLVAAGPNIGIYKRSTQASVVSQRELF